MPTYKLPKPKKPKKGNDRALAVDDDYRRRINLPANEAIINALSVGDSVVVTLHGEVERVENVEGTDYSDRSFSINVSSVEAYPDDADKAKAKEKFDSGFKKTYSKA